MNACCEFRKEDIRITEKEHASGEENKSQSQKNETTSGDDRVRFNSITRSAAKHAEHTQTFLQRAGLRPNWTWCCCPQKGLSFFH